MPSLISILALGALTTLAAADNIYTYTKPGCTGPAFFFKDIDHNVCALSTTGNATSTADAIAKGLTTVASGKLEVQETGEKVFIAWDEGPASNADGLLQCGNAVQLVNVTARETCISGSIHGFTWSEPGSDGSDSNAKVKRKANDDPLLKCTGSTHPNAVYIGENHYNVKDIPAADKKALMECVWNDVTPGVEFKKYIFTPNS